jgi:predicted RND superfamily exporter protein
VRWTAAAVAHPRSTVLAAVLLAVAALAFAAVHLELRTSNLDLVDPELPTVARFRDFAHAFGTPNVLVVVVEGDDPGAVHAAVDDLAPKLRAVAGVRSVVAGLPFDRTALAMLGVGPWFGSADGKLACLFVQPVDVESRAEALAPVVAGVKKVLSEEASDGSHPGISAGVTGLPAYALDDRDVIQHDVSRLSLVAFALVLLLFVTAFGAFVRPLAAMLSLLLAVAVTLGLAAVYPGHLTLLSAFFASILFGLGVDFGIHLVDRVEELLAAGHDTAAALPLAVDGLGNGLVVSALTTAGAFFALAFAGFRGFAELGVVAGAGVLVCLAATFTVLPALLVLLPARRRGERRLEERRLGRLLLALQSRPLAAVLAAAVLLSPLVAHPGFDSDYLNLQPRGSETVRLERDLVAKTDFSPQFAAFVVDDAGTAEDYAASLRRDPTVGAVRSAADLDALAFLSPTSERELAALRDAFVAADGRHAVYAYPDGDVWDPRVRDRFLDHLRRLDPGVTGMPVLGAFMIERSRRALRLGALLGSAVVLLFVAAGFRRLRPTLLAVVPTAGGVALMLALMRLLGIPFNPLNVMALPVVLGIAVDDGVHLVHRWLAEGGDLARTLAGTGRSVVLTSATSLAAFGSLVFTSHRGLASFAAVLCLGVGSALVLSVLLLPQLLRLALPATRIAGSST